MCVALFYDCSNFFEAQGMHKYRPFSVSTILVDMVISPHASQASERASGA
jgi:hypothetical protein